MKFLHTSDWHLGMTFRGGVSYASDQKYAIDRICRIAMDERVDGILLAGDVFDKSIASAEALKLYDEVMTHICSVLNIPVYVIAGNHDGAERLSQCNELLKKSGLYIAGSLSERPQVVSTGDVDIYLLPWISTDRVKAVYPDAAEEINSMEAAYKAVLDRYRDLFVKGRKNILVAHAFIVNAETSVSDRAAEVGKATMIGSYVFDGFDYVALGHIHSPQRVGREEVRYSGSPLKYSLSEVNNEKTVPLITFGEKGDVQVDLIPLTPLRDLRHLKGKLKTLLDNKNIVNANDFIYATLTDEGIIQNAMSIFQETYPNTVKIDFDNSHTRQIEQVDISGIADNKSFPELISDFYRMMYGCEISEEEMDVMRAVAQEVGLLQKAD